MAKNEATLFQRNALAPSIFAAVFLFLAPLMLDGDFGFLVLYVVAIMALIIAWFAIQARQWWWAPIFIAVAVLWNPVYPMPFSGVIWTIAQPVTALVFLIAGAVIKTPRQ